MSRTETPTIDDPRWTVCVSVAVLILYGSWFPFDAIWPDPDDVEWALTNLSLWTHGADVAGNVALFVPWGAAAAAAGAASGRSAMRWSLGVGALLAVLAQGGQLFEAHRDPRWADVFWNEVGAALGLLAWRSWERWRPHAWLVVGVGSLLVAWLPFWPSFSPAHLQAHWHGLSALAPWQGADAGLMAGLALLVGAACRASVERRGTLAALGVGLLIVVGQLWIPGTRLSLGGVLGTLAGGVLGAVWHERPSHLVRALVACQVLGGLAPYAMTASPQAVHWLPFDALLRGSMLGNAQSLARDLWLWGAALWLALRAGAAPGRAAVQLAGWAFAIEWLQRWIPQRVPDATAPMLVLALGWTLARYMPDAAGRRRD